MTLHSLSSANQCVARTMFPWVKLSDREAWSSVPSTAAEQNAHCVEIRLCVLMELNVMILLLWILTPCGLVGTYNVAEKYNVSTFRVEDGDSMFLQNVVIYPRVYLVSQLKRTSPTLFCSVLPTSKNLNSFRRLAPHYAWGNCPSR